MATLKRAPDRAGDGPTRPPARLVGPRVESFVQPSEVESLEEAERLAEARFFEELDAYHIQNVHQRREILVPIVDSEGFEDEITTTVNAAYSGLSVMENRALLLGLAPTFRDRDAFEQAMNRGTP